MYQKLEFAMCGWEDPCCCEGLVVKIVKTGSPNILRSPHIFPPLVQMVMTNFWQRHDVLFLNHNFESQKRICQTVRIFTVSDTLTRHKAMMTMTAFFYELCSDNILLLAWSRKLAFLTPPSRQGSLLQLFLAPNIWKYALNTNYAGTHIHLGKIIYIHPLRPPVCQQLADNYRILKLFKSHITALAVPAPKQVIVDNPFLVPTF